MLSHNNCARTGVSSHPEILSTWRGSGAGLRVLCVSARAAPVSLRMLRRNDGLKIARVVQSCKITKSCKKCQNYV